MRALESTKTRLQSAVTLASELAQGDFPNDHAKQALLELRKVFSDGLSVLEAVGQDSDPNVVKTLCAAESAKLFQLFPYLGFLSRSTEIRNAFEVHGPLLRLVRRLLDADSRLVISSEWQYSPFTFVPPRQSVLSSTVMIGAPASESWNALTLPLAGHELGHNVWARRDLRSQVGPVVLEAIYADIEGPGWSEFQRAFPDVNDKTKIRENLFAGGIVAQCFEWTIRQCEEVFCDCLGLRIFRESFLHSFEYLIAPGLPQQRSPLYPPSKQRAALLQRAAELSSISVSTEYSNSFEDEATPTDVGTRILVTIADRVTAQSMDGLLGIAGVLITNSGIGFCSPAEREQIEKCFALCVPPQGITNLPSIVAGAWDYYLKGMPEWQKLYPEVFESGRSLEMLSDLTFKAIEIHEIEERQAAC